MAVHMWLTSILARCKALATCLLRSHLAAWSGISSQTLCTSKHPVFISNMPASTNDFPPYSYFIGFRDRNVATSPPEHPPSSAEMMALFGLAKPSSDAWLEDGWNADTSEWKW
jgi:hypothetical protein